VTANELLALLGRAWSRLLIYPGGLAAFGVVWLISMFQHRVSARPPTRPDARAGKAELPARASGRAENLLVLSSVILPWLALALLPLPLAVALPRQIDIVVALALLEWPNVLAIRQELRAGGIRRLAAALNSYPPLILAVLALAQANSSLELAALVRDPGDSIALSTRALYWLGVITLTLTLLPALRIGPFAGYGRRTTNDKAFPQTPDPSSIARFFAAGALQLGLRLRALGLVTLAALPWAGAAGDGLALLRLLGAAALIGVLLWGADRLMRGQAARRWAWAYLALDVLLLLALLAAAYLALELRLA